MPLVISSTFGRTVKGKRIFTSKFCCYKKNLVNLHETFVFHLMIVFSNLVRFTLQQLNFFGYSCLFSFFFHIFICVLYPLYILISLRKHLPEFYLYNSNTQDIKQISSPTILIPRYPIITMKMVKTSFARKSQAYISESQEMKTFKSIGLSSSFNSKSDELPEVVWIIKPNQEIVSLK